MRKPGIRINLDIDKIRSALFIELCRNGSATAFTRRRKLPADDVVLTLINRKGLTTSMELHNSMKTIHPGEQISTPGYLKQRMKLNPYAFVDLFQFHNKNYYSDPDTELYTINGYLVLAVDGSC